MRHAVIHEAAREQLPRFGVVVRVLAEDLPRALHDGAVRLAVQDQRIDGVAHVVHGSVPHDLHHARVRVDLHFAHLPAIGKAAVLEELFMGFREQIGRAHV